MVTIFRQIYKSNGERLRDKLLKVKWFLLSDIYIIISRQAKKTRVLSFGCQELRGDLIETFKLLHACKNNNYEIFFKLNNTTET